MPRRLPRPGWRSTAWGGNRPGTPTPPSRRGRWSGSRLARPAGRSRRRRAKRDHFPYEPGPGHGPAGIRGRIPAGRRRQPRVGHATQHGGWPQGDGGRGRPVGDISGVDRLCGPRCRVFRAAGQRSSRAIRRRLPRWAPAGTATGCGGGPPGNRDRQAGLREAEGGVRRVFWKGSSRGTKVVRRPCRNRRRSRLRSPPRSR